MPPFSVSFGGGEGNLGTAGQHGEQLLPRERLTAAANVGPVLFFPSLNNLGDGASCLNLSEHFAGWRGPWKMSACWPGPGVASSVG